MADDASFHSCCEELHQLYHQQQQQQHQEHCQLSIRNNNCTSGCCCSIDTDDEFQTASNSPLELDAAGLPECFGEGCSGGDVLSGIACDLERTLGHSDSHQSLSSATSPTSESPMARARRPVIIASTVVANAPLLGRLDASGCSSGGDVDNVNDDADNGAGDNNQDDEPASGICVGVAAEDAKFPPPLASSSRVSLVGLRQAATPTSASGDDATRSGGGGSGSSGDAGGGAAAVSKKLQGAALDGKDYYCYRDNELTPHRPGPRRTQSGPLPRQQFSADSLLLASSCRHNQHHHRELAPPPPPTAKKGTKPAAPIDTVDFPARLRKRVRFADALGFDLTSVVVIAAASGGCSECSGSGRSEFETFLVDAESELNRARLFAESPALSPSQQQLQPSPMTTDAGSWAPVTPWEPQPPSRDRPVSLESVRFDGPALELSALVLNLAPDKSVTVRVTFDSWRHQADWSLRYCHDEAAACSERFRMRLYLPPNASSMEMALRYCVAGQQYWDNNAGGNYAYRIICNQAGP